MKVVFLITIFVIQASQGQQSEHFQLVTRDGNCLQVTKNTGIINSCKDTGGNFTVNTVYYLSGAPGTYSLHIVGSLGLCLDREHCHSGSSDLRYSECDHCGAIHWNIITNTGAVCEDACKNCIYLTSNVTAAVHHCTDGHEAFNKTLVGPHQKDQLLMKNYYQRMHLYAKKIERKDSWREKL